MGAINRRWISASSNRTRKGGVYESGAYASLIDDDEDDLAAERTPTPIGDESATTTSSTKTRQLKLNFATISTKKRSHTLNNTNNDNDDDEADAGADKAVDADDDVDDKPKKQKKDPIVFDVNIGESPAEPDPKRTYGAIVADRQQRSEPTKRLRGRDVADRKQHSWANAAFSLVRGRHACELCLTTLQPDGGSTASRRNHYNSKHKTPYALLVAAAAAGKNGAAFEKIVQAAKPTGTQLTLHDDIPVPKTTVTAHRLKALVMLLQIGGSYQSIDNVALQSFFALHELDTFSSETAASLVSDVGRVIKQIRFDSLQEKNLLINCYFDELDIKSVHFLGVTISFATMSTPARIHRFPLRLVRCDPDLSTGLAFGNRLRDIVDSAVPSSVTLFTMNADNNSTVQCAARTAIAERVDGIHLDAVPPSSQVDGVGGCISHKIKLLLEAAIKDCPDIGDAFARAEYAVRFVLNHEKVMKEWSKYATDVHSKPIKKGGDNRWWMGLVTGLHYMTESRAYASVAKMSPAADVSRLPTAEGVQTLGDVVGLLTQVRSLERLHEDRSLPTMALVIDTVEQVHSIFRAFVQVNIDDEVAHLVTYGQALLRHTEAYFGAYLAPNSLAARAGFLGCALPKTCYSERHRSVSTRFPVLPNRANIIEAIKEDFLNTFPPTGPAQIHDQLRHVNATMCSLVLELVGNEFEENDVEASEILAWWDETLHASENTLGENRASIQQQISSHLPRFVDYIAAMLSLFSSTTEAERMFREVGRQDEGRESLTDEHLEAEALLLDYVKSNAFDAAEHGAIVDDLAARIDDIRQQDAVANQAKKAKEKSDRIAFLQDQLAAAEAEID